MLVYIPLSEKALPSRIWKEAGDQVLWLSGERVFKAEEAASAQDLGGGSKFGVFKEWQGVK